MTIAEILDLIVESRGTYNQQFAEEFHDKLTQVCATREALDEAGFAEPTAAVAFLNSWSEVLSLFASDPSSLLAFTAPEIEVPESAMCAAELRQLFPQSVIGTPNTQRLFLYDVAVSLELQGNVAMSAVEKPTARLTAKPKPKPKPKPRPKRKAKPKAAKKKPKPKAKVSAKPRSKKKKAAKR